MATVVLIVSLEVARALHAGDTTQSVVDDILSLGGRIYPMPAYAPGEPGERTFTIEVPRAEELCTKLKGRPGVEACYIKPGDEPP